MKKHFYFCSENKSEFWKPKSVDLLDAHTITVVVHGELSASLTVISRLKLFHDVLQIQKKIFSEINLEVSMLLVLNSRANILINEFMGMI